MEENYDLTVIGGGAGGLFSASVGNTLGAKTCMIEKKRLGGDCTWFGCIPSKALIHAAGISQAIKNAKDVGIRIFEQPRINTELVMAHVRSVVKEISTHHPASVFEGRGIKVKFGTPRFIDNHTLQIDEDRIRSKKFIICTGSHPVVLPIEGLKDIDYFTNENIFDIDKLPESLIVLGGGPIGVELAQALSRLGVKITIVEMIDRLLFREDPRASSLIAEKLRQEGIVIKTGKKAVKFDKKDGRVHVEIEDSSGTREEILAENVLVAVGRAPNLEGLVLDAAGVRYNKTGIDVDKYLQTTNRNIFACGDVVGPYLFSHVAAYQATVCVRNALFRRLAWQKVNYANVAWATFTDPEVARLGLTEEQAREQHKKIKVYESDYGEADRAVTDGHKDGLVKIITDRKGRILGANIVGANAGEIIQGLLVIKALGRPISKIASAMYIYPTLSELIKKSSAKSLIEKMDNPLVKFALKIMRKY